MTELVELLPCPFCGSNDIDAREDGSPFAICCRNCCAEMPYMSLDDPQSVRWNARARPTYDQPNTYVAGQYVFNYLRTFLALAGVDASDCRLVIELPDRDIQRQLVSVLQRDSQNAPERSAARIGNHSGTWQGVEYEFGLKALKAIDVEAMREALEGLRHPAVTCSLKFLRSRFEKAKCDSEAVADCARCNVMFLVNRVDAALSQETKS